MSNIILRLFDTVLLTISFDKSVDDDKYSINDEYDDVDEHSVDIDEDKDDASLSIIITSSAAILKIFRFTSLFSLLDIK
jgi:hypothetical protein